jgi:hypothetical protein
MIQPDRPSGTAGAYLYYALGSTVTSPDLAAASLLMRHHSQISKLHLADIASFVTTL